MSETQIPIFPTITPDVARRYIAQARAEKNEVSRKIREALAPRPVHISEAITELAQGLPSSPVFWKGLRLDD